MFNFYLILIVVISYLLGSFPTAYLLVKKFTPLEKPAPTSSIWGRIRNFLTGFTGQDIRKIGSGNIGAMNTIRVLKDKSKKLALIGFLVVLFIDMAKGAGAIFVAQKLFAYSQYSHPFVDSYYIFLTLAAFFVILGHNYSIFLKFAGGRGAASLIGILLYLDIFSFLIWALPVVICTIFAQVILEKIRFEEKINWKKISNVIALFGKQMAGRLAGLILAPFLLYFYNHQIFFPIVAGTILLLIRNIPRFKGYFLGEKTSE